MPISGRRLTSRIARALGEMCLIQITLKCIFTVQAFATVQIPRDDKRTEEQVALSAALFRDSVLQFCECFKPNGGRKGYYLDRHEVYGTGTETDKLFATLGAIRVGYAAHRHGPGQKATVMAVLDDAGHVAGIGCEVSAAVNFDYENIMRFGLIVQQAREFVDRRIDALRADLFAEVNNMTTETLLDLPIFERKQPTFGDFSQSRDQFDDLAKKR